MSNEPVEINLEFTPNPNTLKYAVNRRLLVSGAEYFKSPEEAAELSPMAVKLFNLEHVSAVMIGQDFFSVTVDSDDNLRELNQQITGTVSEHLEAGQEVCAVRDRSAVVDEDEASQKIRQIIDDEIRPAVAKDGGDITFERYEDGVVVVFMKGACAGCPHAAMTLKMGLEERLKQAVPEITGVTPLMV